MSWANYKPPSNWQQPVIATNPYDAMSRDEILIEWQKKKDALAKAKEAEMEMRKYIVGRAFPQATEGVNTLDLGNGYSLKAGVKFNYKLDPDLDKIEKTLDEIAKVGNEGSFIADRLVKWSADFKLTEYRLLCANDANDTQKQIKKLIDGVLIIDDAAPTLEIKTPKVKK